MKWEKNLREKFITTYVKEIKKVEFGIISDYKKRKKQQLQFQKFIKTCYWHVFTMKLVINERSNRISKHNMTID